MRTRSKLSRVREVKACVIRNLDSFCVASQTSASGRPTSFFVQRMNFVPEIFALLPTLLHTYMIHKNSGKLYQCLV